MAEKVVIKSLNPKYSGVSASLQFVNGEAETDDKWLIEWFGNKGYKVEKPQETQQEIEPIEEKEAEPKKKSGKTKAKELDDKKDE
ncbi:hypothetical protein NX029_04125 [Cytobacillus firmus]|uniref:hypothetical protein n=1 Tax=Cytobacillus TaxID=2675230 RepID=UPI0020418870|nr:hypothetical protein [Cytobacillus oceanisediminis]MCM3241581.1 hypothetical protein [Cytobacillus oceanisediminis]MCS0823144.1 hypothetical protein [Cytobacillus firmus]